MIFNELLKSQNKCIYIKNADLKKVSIALEYSRSVQQFHQSRTEDAVTKEIVLESDKVSYTYHILKKEDHKLLTSTMELLEISTSPLMHHTDEAISKTLTFLDISHSSI